MSEPSPATAAPALVRLGDHGPAVSEIRSKLDLLGLIGRRRASKPSPRPA